MQVLQLVLTIIGAIFTFGALLIATGQFLAALYPIWLESINRQILNKKFSMGPYDTATIERSTKYYIKPKCSNIDPAQEQEPRHALVVVKEDLFKKIDDFIKYDETRRHLLILADSGMGKTSLVLNYYARNSRYRNRQRLALVPLGVKNAEELIRKIPNQEETVIFLDALDEDVKAIGNHRDRITFLMEECRQFKKIVITCRTQFFPKAEEVPIETGILRLGPRKAGDKGSYEFWKLYLSPFDNADLENYLHKRYPFWHYRQRQRALDIALKIPLLTVRPMLLAHIPDIVASQTKIQFSYQLYEIMVNAWLERESYWVNKEILRNFSEKLALDIYSNRAVRGNEGVLYDDLKKLANSWNIKLDNWQLGGRSLLNRDANDNYKFAHRSIMEYLVVKKVIDDKQSVGGVILTDQMKSFFAEKFSTNQLVAEFFDAIYNETSIQFSKPTSLLSTYGMSVGFDAEKLLEEILGFKVSFVLSESTNLLSFIENSIKQKLGDDTFRFVLKNPDKQTLGLLRNNLSSMRDSENVSISYSAIVYNPELLIGVAVHLIDAVSSLEMNTDKSLDDLIILFTDWKKRLRILFAISKVNFSSQEVMLIPRGSSMKDIEFVFMNL